MSTFARLSTGPNEDLVRELMNPTLQRDYAYFYRPLMAINRAHVVMLAEQAILDRTDAVAILRGLETVEAELTAATLCEDLDLYFNVERRLQSAIGPVAGRMHTARSRNDLQACYQRMAVRDRLDGLIGDVLALRTTVVELAEAHIETVMPGYTHTQPAQPITFGHYLVSVHDAFARDEERVLAARRRTNFSPLGSGALAATGFPIDRPRTAALLGFDGLVESSLDAVASRDYVVEALAACVGVASTASRMSADLIAWSAWEYRFVELADGYASGSSIMPQKKNPLALEHTRAKLANVLAAYTAAASLAKGLPFTHSRDTGSEMFHLAFDGVAEAGLVVRVLAGVLGTLTVHTDRMAAAADNGYATATELADTLVRRCGLPFRTAHDIVGAMVGRTVSSGAAASAWTLDQLYEVAAGVGADVSALSADDLHSALDARRNVAVRDVVGGPAPSEVRRMLRTRRQSLTDSQRVLEGLRAQLDQADRALSARVAEFRSTPRAMDGHQPMA
jgi:argininosuccinate lyase